ncbi:MAG TPA: matrixin family metalloprotease [Kofleriaceae bacterium]|nr:matrixin family metalloprotease [Kofleriaceae bacterium]
MLVAVVAAVVAAAAPRRAEAGDGEGSGDRAHAAQRARPRVCVVPLGPHDRPLLLAVMRGIEELYGLEVEIREPVALPASAYYAPRRRYRAEKLLAFLDRRARPGDCDLNIGFTDADISTSKGTRADWGVLGLAWIGGPSGVVSTHRLGKRIGPRARAMRAVKVVNHELGHALGLEHHERRGCLMEDAGGTVKTVDRESGLLCDDSRRELEERNGFALPALTRFNWSRVLD